jgi:serine/threonine protein kinase
MALGRGGVGTVYRAKDRRDGRSVALKMLSIGPALEPRAARRLAMEFEALAVLSHPNVVRVLDAGVHDGYPYLAMELVDGLDLRRWLSLNGDEPLKAVPRAHELPHELPLRSLAERRESSLPWFDQSGGGRSSFDHSAEAPHWAASWQEEASFGENEADSDRGLRELKELAWAADEPDTDERASADHEPHPATASAHDADTSEASDTPARAPVDLKTLNRPHRMARLRDSMVQLCDALAYIHGRGLVHRDVKPANVMVDDTQRVRLMDFGLAKFLARAEQEVTQAGRIVGTYRYVSPEILRAEPVDGRADLYSLGVTLYELCCGIPPFDADNPKDLWTLVLESDAPPLQTLNPGIDRGLALITHRLLRKNPEDRFQTAEEVAEALLDV